MEQRANFLDDGIDQVKEAWSSVEDEFGKLQKNLEKRRKRFEKETQKQVRRFERTSIGTCQLKYSLTLSSRHENRLIHKELHHHRD